MKYADIRRKALAEVAIIDPKNAAGFSCSNGWIHGFLKRFDLCIRRKTTSRLSAERDSPIVQRFISEVETIVRQRGIRSSDIINMEETGAWADMSFLTTVEQVGAQQVAFATVRNSKTRVTVVVSITAPGNVLKSMVIFRGKRMTA